MAAAAAAVGLIGAACGSGGEGTSSSPTVTLGEPTGAGPVSCPLGTALVAADVVTGAMLWSHCAGSTSGIEVLGASDTAVLAAEYDERGGGVRLVGLDAATGAERWRRTVPPFNESYERDAFYADGARGGSAMVVFSELDAGSHTMVGVDLETGEQRWRVDALGAFVAGHGEEVAIAAAPGAMFETPSDAAQPDLLVAAFDRRTGEVRWRRDRGIRDMGAPWGPRLGDGLFVFTQIDPQPEDAEPAELRWETVALDANSGAPRWRRERGPLLLISAAGDTGVGLRPGASSDRFELEGFATDSGRSRWRVELAAGWPIVHAAPGSPVVSVALAALELDGIDERSPATTATAAPADARASVSVYDRESGRLRFLVAGEAEPAGIVGQLVLIARTDEVVALDATDGSRQWSLPFAHPFGTEVQQAAGRVFLSSSAGLGDPPSASGSGPVANLSTGTELASFTVGGETDGTTIRFVQAADPDGTEHLCILVDEPESISGTYPVDVERCSSSEDPMLSGSEGDVLRPTPRRAMALPDGLVHPVFVVRLPAGAAQPVTVRDASGATWPSATTASGLLYLLDPASGATGLREVLEIVGPEGQTVARVQPFGS